VVEEQPSPCPLPGYRERGKREGAGRGYREREKREGVGRGEKIQCAAGVNSVGAHSRAVPSGTCSPLRKIVLGATQRWLSLGLVVFDQRLLTADGACGATA
jgi:hypothetical protein